jgi:prepilin-type N-terminal cleavage/methylation domain-containing protein
MHDIHSPRRTRSGFTLIELLVALVLLDVGLLALAGASAAASRVVRGARSDAGEVEVSSARLERLLSSPCGAAVAGASRPAPGLAEWWADTPAPNGTRLLSDSIVQSTSRGPRILALHGAGRC